MVWATSGVTHKNIGTNAINSDGLFELKNSTQAIPFFIRKRTIHFPFDAQAPRNCPDVIVWSVKKPAEIFPATAKLVGV